MLTAAILIKSEECRNEHGVFMPIHWTGPFKNDQFRAMEKSSKPVLKYQPSIHTHGESLEARWRKSRTLYVF